MIVKKSDIRVSGGESWDYGEGSGEIMMLKSPFFICLIFVIWGKSSKRKYI